MTRLFAFILALVLLAPVVASADPGSESWVRFDGSASPEAVTFISGGSAALLVINNGDTNSKILQVNSPNAFLCFDPNIAAAVAGTARVTVKMAMTYDGADNAAITLPAIPSDGTDCVDIARGRFWVNIDVTPPGAEVAHVIVQGR